MLFYSAMTEQANSGGGGTVKTSRVAILLSATVWPGAGQFAQKRWVAGAIYALSFLACFIVSMTYGVRIMLAYYGMWDFDRDHGDSNATSIKPHLVKMLIFFVIAVGIFIAALIDVVIVHIRRLRAVRNSVTL